MNFKKTLDRILSSHIDGYVEPEYWEFGNVEICYKPAPEIVETCEWRETLEEWMPIFEEHGLTDGIKKIYIGDGIVGSNAAGRYHPPDTIDLELDLSFLLDGAMSHGCTKSSVLTHEVVHHAHLTLNGFRSDRSLLMDESYIRNEVGYYAAKNVGEFVAETGTGIVHGEKFPDKVHEMYEEYDGPKEVYEIRETR